MRRGMPQPSVAARKAALSAMGASRSTRRAWARSSGSMSDSGAMCGIMPALLISVALAGRGPCLFSHWRNIAAASRLCERSSGHCSSWQPACAACAASAALSLREMHSRVWPGASSCCAMASPMPREAPVRM